MKVFVSSCLRRAVMSAKRSRLKAVSTSPRAGEPGTPGCGSEGSRCHLPFTFE